MLQSEPNLKQFWVPRLHSMTEGSRLLADNVLSATSLGKKMKKNLIAKAKILLYYLSLFGCLQHPFLLVHSAPMH